MMTPLLAPALLTAASIELGSIFDAAALAALPSGREPWSLLRTAEPTISADRIDAGGLFLGAPALFGVHGTSWTDTTWRLGDVDITDPDRGGTPLIDVPAEALESLTLTTALTPVAVGGSGANVALAVRAPRTSWHGALAVHTTPSGLAGSGDGVAPPIAAMHSWDDLSLTAGGPVNARLGVFAVARGTRSERRQRGTAARLPSDTRSLLVHALYRPNAQDEWRMLAAAATADLPAAGRARFAGAPARDEEGAVHAQAAFHRRGPSGPAWRAAIAYQENGGAPAASVDTVEIERLRDGPLTELYASKRRVRRFDVTAAVLPDRLRMGGRNEVTLGVALEQSAAAWTSGDNPSGATGELVDGLPARAWLPTGSVESSAHASQVALFADDRLALTESLLVEGGLRFALRRAASETGAGRISWTTLSPRIAARWSPLRAVGLFAGWQRIHPRLPLQYLQWGDAAAPQYGVFRWDDTGDARLDLRERGPLVSRVGPGGAYSSIDADLRPPSTAGVVAGFDLRPGGGWWIRFAGIHRRTSDLVESVNTGVTVDDYDVSFVDDPSIDIVGPGDDRLLPVHARQPASFGRDEYVLTNPAGHEVLMKASSSPSRSDSRSRCSCVSGGPPLARRGPAGTGDMAP